MWLLFNPMSTGFEPMPLLNNWLSEFFVSTPNSFEPMPALLRPSSTGFHLAAFVYSLTTPPNNYLLEGTYGEGICLLHPVSSFRKKLYHATFIDV